MTLEIDLTQGIIRGNAKAGDIKRLGLLKASMEEKQNGTNNLERN